MGSTPISQVCKRPNSRTWNLNHKTNEGSLIPSTIIQNQWRTTSYPLTIIKHSLQTETVKTIILVHRTVGTYKIQYEFGWLTPKYYNSESLRNNIVSSTQCLLLNTLYRRLLSFTELWAQTSQYSLGHIRILFSKVQTVTE